MDFKRALAVASVLALAGCGGSSGDSGTVPGNHAPEVSFTFKPLATEKGIPVDLTISATDVDNDPLTISWKITRGALTAQNSKKTIMEWATPATLGVDTVTVSVSDGSVTKKLTEEIRVATAYGAGNFIKANSPYLLTRSPVDARLPIPDGATLTIEPGTEIYVNTPGTVFDVQGTLSAHGTTGQHIVIRMNDRSFVCGGDNLGIWAGIRGSVTGVIDLEYVELWYAQYGVRVQNDAVAELQNVMVRCSGAAGLLMEGNRYVHALDSQFTDAAGDGIDVVTHTTLPDSVRIERCNTSFNHGSGIRLDIDDVTKSTPVIVSYNDIEFNDTHGISLASAVFPTMHFNNFRGNGDSAISNLFMQSGYPTVSFPELDATCNFWGVATHQSTVDEGIWDSLDQATVHTRVKSCPWLKSNPLTTTPDCSMSCPAP
jgi:hypothetical protein